jgi:hypothetical protein
MLEAFIRAKSQITETQLAEKNKQEFLTFIRNTRKFIPGFLSHVKPFDENNYGETIPVTIQGFFINNIDPTSDLGFRKMEDYSMDVFIGREKMGEITAWIGALLHLEPRLEPRMLVDVAIQHIPSGETVTNEVFIIHRDTIEMWDRIHAERPVSLPSGKSQHTQLITDVLEYAAKLPKPSGSKK